MQFDSSYHRWLVDHPKIYLILGIDDAKGEILGGRFTQRDTTMENMRVLKEIFESKGLPLSIYLDRDSKFKTTRYRGIHYNIQGGEYRATQIKRAMNELGIKLIYALSPQAKGRIERGFQTLQDRLIKELRLNGIKTIEAANHYLKEKFIPKYNRRFAKQPKEPGKAYMKLKDGMDLEGVLCLKEERKVYNDNTVSYKGIKFQILPDAYRACYAKLNVTVEEHLNGEIALSYNGRKLNFKELKAHRIENQSIERPDIFNLQET